LDIEHRICRITLGENDIAFGMVENAAARVGGSKKDRRIERPLFSIS
jgi:hypothetical protein